MALDRISPLCYPGLRSFEPREGSMFFGRDASLTDVQKRLARNRTLVVLGGSGSGKSSLIRAGILPFLNSSRPIDDRDGVWFWAEFRPRTTPLVELAGALQRVLDDQVEASATDSATAAALRQEAADIAASFRSVAPDEGNRLTTAERLSDRLLDFARILDDLDFAEHGEYRAGPVNFMLLLDQFEEVFRPEVDTRVREQLLDLLVVTHGRIESAAATHPGGGPGLFMVVTMRSEELHRCAEHAPLPDPDDAPVPDATRSEIARSLTDLVNESFYLLRLLDPEKDQASLRDAILRPVREVLRAYELPSEASDNPDYPYENGIVDWLLAGTTAIGGGTEHQPDQMPLLQHALRQMWLNAVEEWPTIAAIPVIHKTHLFATAGSDAEAKAAAEKAAVSEVAEVQLCLRRTADWTAAEAGRNAVPGESKESTRRLREAVLKAVFRSLARRDDRNNWARRFGTVTHMIRFLACDRNAAALQPEAREATIERALRAFTAEGLVHRSMAPEESDRASSVWQYDISHEALIRNWTTCQDWLLPLEIVTVALARALTDMTPQAQTQARNEGLSTAYLVPERTAKDLAPLEPVATTDLERLPQEWAWGEIAPRLDGADARRKWSLPQGKTPPTKQDGQRVLDRILALRRDAEGERRWKKRGRGALAAAAGIATLAGVYLGAAWNTAATGRENANRAATAAALLNHATRLYPAPGEAPKFAESAVELGYAADLLSRAGKVAIPPDKFLPRVHQMWDGTARQMFGTFLFDPKGLLDLGPPVSHDATCLVVGAGTATKAVTLSLSGKQHTARLAQMARQDGQSGTGGRLWLPVDGADAATTKGPHDTAFTLPVADGDRVCISADGQILAWVYNETPETVTLGEVTWLWRDNQPTPYVVQVQQASGTSRSDANSRSAGKPLDATCIRQFFTRAGKIGGIQGVRFEAIPISDTDGTRLGCPDGKHGRVGELAHLTTVNNFSPLADATGLAGAECQSQSPTTWTCNDQKVAFRRAKDGRPQLAAVVIDSKSGNETAAVAVPMVKSEEIKQVYLRDGRVIVETDGDLRFALVTSGKHMLDMLSQIDPAGRPELTDLCQDLPGCPEWVKAKRRETNTK